MMLSSTGADRMPLWVAARPVRAGGHHRDMPRVSPTGGPHLLLLLLLSLCSLCVNALCVSFVCQLCVSFVCQGAVCV